MADTLRVREWSKDPSDWRCAYASPGCLGPVEIDARGPAEEWVVFSCRGHAGRYEGGAAARAVIEAAERREAEEEAKEAALAEEKRLDGSPSDWAMSDLVKRTAPPVEEKLGWGALTESAVAQALEKMRTTLPVVTAPITTTFEIGLEPVAVLNLDLETAKTLYKILGMVSASGETLDQVADVRRAIRLALGTEALTDGQSPPA